MNALFKAEMLKVRGTRTLVALLVATLGLVILTAVMNVPSAGHPVDGVSLDDRALLARVVGVSFGVLGVLMCWAWP